jgi:putative methyltransferase (TIGR04325 family)
MGGTGLGRWLPAVLTDRAARWLGRSTRFTRATGDWAQAVAASGGYDDDAILARVLDASRAVRAGRAAYERDGVAFAEPAVPFQLAAPLLRHALRHDAQVDLVDFGGSLGSSFHQLRSWLPPLRALRWQVVEQPHFVAAGRAEFETAELRFFESLDQLAAPLAPRLVLLSSVLQYLPAPHAVLAQLAGCGADTIVVDRTPFADAADDLLCHQHVPAHIYRAVYPCWVFSTTRFRRTLPTGWAETLRFPCTEGAQAVEGGPTLRFEGCILERRP